ncbi:MAG: hypothetical protein DRP52_03675 [Planctomycetota bacterium]|nr:MAG: hypothetical protein DRP52_03675 [Planctomycetota bacterium]
MSTECKGLGNKELTGSPQNPLQTSLQKDSEDTSDQGNSYPAELQELINQWDELPEHVRQTIQMLVESAK